MQIRGRFVKALSELRDEIVLMGSRVEFELKLALEALEQLDTEKARKVFEIDKGIDQTRFDIEDKCFTLIVTQQPAASDLRLIVAAMNIIVDLERMGDQAKGIAKLIPHLQKRPELKKPSELQIMGQMVINMLNEAMAAYAADNIAMAQMVVKQDEQVDALFAQVFTHVMFEMSRATDPDEVESIYKLLRAARELERYGDLATNIAERTIYLVTGELRETNVDTSLAEPV